jgi:hypothetical protein
MRLQDLKIVFVSPDHNEKYQERTRHMKSMLASIGYTDVTHYKSSTERYPRCLSEATIDILEQNMDTPVLIIEDDVEFTGVEMFDFVENADAIYFGLSKSAGHPTENRDLGHSMFMHYSDTQVRVINMLTTHAILYISRQYKQAVIDVLKTHLFGVFYNDVLISRLQPNYLVLANKKPSFYQSARFNTTDHEERWTKWEIP